MHKHQSRKPLRRDLLRGGDAVNGSGDEIVKTESDPRTTRARFLRRVGALAAVGLGASTFARSAHAQPTICCLNSSQCPSGCGPQGTSPGWWCTGACGGCCLCLDTTDNCKSFNCPCP